MVESLLITDKIFLNKNLFIIASVKNQKQYTTACFTLYATIKYMNENNSEILW